MIILKLHCNIIAFSVVFMYNTDYGSGFNTNATDS